MYLWWEDLISLLQVHVMLRSKDKVIKEIHLTLGNGKASVTLTHSRQITHSSPITN